MNWATLAEIIGGPRIIEKIIYHAADDEDTKNHNKGLERSHQWLLRIQKFCQVCGQWKEVIMSSPKLFSKRDMNGQFLCYMPVNNNGQDLKSLISDGFVRVVKELSIKFVDLSSEDLDLISRNADDNRIEKLGIDFMGINWQDIWSCQFNLRQQQKLVKLFDKFRGAHIFELWFDTTDQKSAVALWEVLRGAIYCNDKPKDLTVRSYSGRIYDIDWSFIGGGIESIKRLRVDGIPRFPFSRLGNIDTISLHWYAIWDSEWDEIITRITAKSLEIEMGSVAIGPDWFDELNSRYCETFKWPIPSTSTVHVTLKVCTDRKVEKTFTATYKCAALRRRHWQIVREWLLDIHVSKGF